MRSIHGTVFILAAVSAGLLSTGCQVAQYNSVRPQTHFDYPNSNVSPLGPVKVAMTGPSGFIKLPDIMCSDTDSTVYQAALAKVPGSTLVTDYTKQYTVYGFWVFYWSKLELEGTACKMEVGRQDINH